MKALTLVVRRLLTVAFVCGLFAMATPEAHAQCGELLVIIGNSGSGTGGVSKVTCEHGYSIGSYVPNNAIQSGQAALIILQQSSVYGPNCTITISGGSNQTAVLSAQQNFCSSEAGSITASVVSGSATYLSESEGSYSSSLPGMVWFAINM